MSDLVQPEGLVVAVSMSPEHGFPTYPQDEVFIGDQGIPGDAHSGPERRSFSNPGTLKPNDRPICIVSDEVRLEMNERFGLNMQPGDFAEQILVQGLGDLGQVALGSEVSFSTGVRLEVVDRAWPCGNLATYHHVPGLVKALNIKLDGDGERYSKRGLLTKVLRAGNLRAGDQVTIS